jgi:UDPglucose 6-dehydrogenase
MRVAFFNELDSYALEHDLDARSIINGVSADSRIGKFYNNPSFGYGGYCLPKDTKQVLSNFKDTPQNLIKAIVESNKTRINFIAQKIIKLAPRKVGIYRLIMKTNSDNWRESSLMHLINKLMRSQIKIVVYEPLMSNLDMDSVVEFVDTLESLDKETDLILTNRMDENILKYESKIFTRDLYGDN